MESPASIRRIAVNQDLLLLSPQSSSLLQLIEVRMKKIIRALAIFTFLYAASSAGAQSANKILDRYQKAVGGNAVKKVKSTSVSGTLTASGGSAGGGVTGRFTQLTS